MRTVDVALGAGCRERVATAARAAEIAGIGWSDDRLLVHLSLNLAFAWASLGGSGVCGEGEDSQNYDNPHHVGQRYYTTGTWTSGKSPYLEGIQEFNSTLAPGAS